MQAELIHCEFSPRMKDLTGCVFGNVTVVGFAGVFKRPDGDNTSAWNCRCSCGKVFVTRGACLIHGNTKSCGHLKAERAALLTHSHGMSAHPFYFMWNGMIQRCANTKHKYYQNYGGRGITVCERWLTFENFRDDMFATYKDGLSIDRVDNEIGYNKDNCKWSTRVEQANNTRSNLYLTIDGQKHTVAEWSRMSGINYQTITSRIIAGWLPKDCVFRIPFGGHSKKGKSSQASPEPLREPPQPLSSPCMHDGPQSLLLL